MAVTTIFNIDMSLFRKGIAKAKAAIESYANKVRETINKTKNSIKTGLEVGGMSGDKFGKFSEFFGNFSKLGVIALGAASAIKIVNAAFDAMAEKLQNNIARVRMNGDEINKAAEAEKKRAEQNRKTFDELEKLAAVENKSAAEKELAVRLVDKLNRAYKGLGLSINEATGQVTGLDGAQKKMLEVQYARQKKYLEMQIKNAQAEFKALERSVKHNTGIWEDIRTQGRSSQQAMNDAKAQMAVTDKLAQLYSQLENLTQDQQDAVDRIAAAKGAKEREALAAAQKSRQSDIDSMAEENYMKQYAMEHSELDTELERYRRKRERDGSNGKVVGYWKEIEREIRRKHELLALEKKLAAEAEAKKQKEIEAANARKKAEDDAKRAAESARRAKEQADRKELAEMQAKFREGENRKLGNIAVITNALTARGGFAAGGRVTGVAEYNRKILSHNDKQQRLLASIEKQMQKVTKEI